ncbi:MAG: YihY/virulence factor BrkB family protein [Actinobacteria bacterium]|nr:YihY/virulence factor BrkB family protein [Actinomycetota bacterium]
MITWWEQFSKRPLVAHVLRAIERFNTRGGTQLAAAIAYHSVLSMVPILMLAFAALGMTLTVLMPEALTSITAWIEESLSGAGNISQQILPVIEDSLNNWATTLTAALAIGFWFGSNWVGNLKRAVRLLMRSDVDNPGKLLPLPLDLLSNFAGLIAMFVGVVVTFITSSAASTLTEQVGRLLGLDNGPGWGLLLRVIGLVISFAAGTGLFWLLFAWFSPERVPGGHMWFGAGVGAAGLLVLQLTAGLLVKAFSRNLTAGVFGGIIILMIFLNLFASLILFIAAWLATQAEPEPEPAPAPEPEQEPVETKPGQLYVSAKVAEQSMGAGLKAGYAVGAATGLGLGALLVGGLRLLFGRRPR